MAVLTDTNSCQDTVIVETQTKHDGKELSEKNSKYVPKWSYSSGYDNNVDMANREISFTVDESLSEGEEDLSFVLNSDANGLLEISTTNNEKDMDLDNIGTEVEDDTFQIDSSTNDLPGFANETNKKLFEEIRRLEEARYKTDQNTVEYTERLKIMTEHTKHVTQELEYSNHLLAAKGKENQTEKHMISLTERETESFKKSLTVLRSRSVNEKSKLSSLQQQIFSLKENIESFIQQKKLNQNELDKWIKTVTEKENDNLALQKYTRDDETKIKDLSLSIEKLTSLSVEKKALVENKSTEAQSCRAELDRMAETFKSHHAQRQGLVRQWQETIATIKKRDDDINTISLKYGSAKDNQEEKELLLRKTQTSVSNVTKDVSVMEQAIESSERSLQLKREQYNETVTGGHEFNDEIESLQRELMAAESALRNNILDSKALENDLSEREKLLRSSEVQLQTSKENLKSEASISQTCEMSVKDVENIILKKEKTIKAMNISIQGLKSKVFKESQSLTEAVQVETDLKSDIKCTEARQKNLSSKLKSIESDIVRQRELVYNASYQLVLMEKKVARGLGERSDEEQRYLKDQIEELQLELDQKREKVKTLVQQSRRLDFELKNWQRKYESNSNQREKLKCRIEDIELEIASCEQSLKSVYMKKDETTVSNDTMQLELRRLCDDLRRLTKSVYRLQNEKEEQSLIIAKKKQENDLQIHVKQMELKTNEEERRKNAIELGQRKLVAEKLKSKYETISMTCSDRNGEDSHVFYLITAAQRREELLREGGELDKIIRQKEKEMRALEKTLSHLQDRNTAFRKHFAKADMNGQEAKELVKIECQLRLAQDRQSQLNVERRKLENELQDRESTFLSINEQIETVTKHLLELKASNILLEDTANQRQLHREIFSGNDLRHDTIPKIVR